MMAEVFISTMAEHNRVSKRHKFTPETLLAKRKKIIWIWQERLSRFFFCQDLFYNVLPYYPLATF